MKWEVRTVKVRRNSWIYELATSYADKVSRFQDLSIKFVKDESSLLKGVDPKDWVIVCDERGNTPTSKEFAQEMENLQSGGKQKVFFLVGGPFGITGEIKKRANKTLSLSHFVFNQEVALAVLFEQLFRCQTLIHNHPYHNE